LRRRAVDRRLWTSGGNPAERGAAREYLDGAAALRFLTSGWRRRERGDDRPAHGADDRRRRGGRLGFSPGFAASAGGTTRWR
jgi:hypothetical protein